MFTASEQAALAMPNSEYAENYRRQLLQHVEELFNGGFELASSVTRLESDEANFDYTSSKRHYLIADEAKSVKWELAHNAKLQVEERAEA